ncbi:hypothetical protein Glove_492g3 [Diversispora epigaea]|uniref:Uncharacterized protein n=1 Tax=Diversispora epigaea TaxID=1348612 RepID=A0A397GP13_9GLOM|nr:hypothetical protein Glove_492g3 [Diversispora epigaea]
MYHLDLGLFKYQIEFTMELLKKKKSLNKVNERIANIPRHSQLKVFKKGIQLSRLTASEYRDMMKIMVFVVDDLQIENLSEVYVKWNEMYLLSRSEKFKESDLENFQKAINDWGDLFIKLFQNISNSHLKFPKLHSWIYHIVDTIREYRAINRYTTETYESLHKTYMKIPYRLSNKKEVEKQIMENIRRRAIVSRNRVGKTKTPMAFVYTAKLFDFDLSESMIEQNKIDLNLDKKMIKGFEKFIDCLKVYLNILNIISAEGCRIKIYSSVTLKNGAILHTKNDFHHRPWFSNIAVNMNEEELSEYLSDKGICYAQTLLITEIRLPNKSPMHLALVQWYDFIEETPFVYGCPLLRLVEVYNFIEIEAIEDTIHVVLRFDKNNEYFATTPPTSRQKKIFESISTDQDYAGDISFGEISHSSNIPEEYENFDEILPASLQSNEEPVSHSSNIPEEYENFDEILPASLQSNEEPEVENIREFPNEAYADLMALVIENNLNNKAGNTIIKFFNKHSDLSQLSPLSKNIETGRKFMDKMNISQLSYSKYCVLTHNSQDYFVHYRPIKNCIKNLLSNPDILKNLMFRYKNSKIEDEKSYGEQNSGNWWKRAERSILNHANILSIILYSDATTTDTLGKSSLHPIYVFLGNIFTWRRNKENAKQLLGYLPILSAKNEKEKKSSEFKELARETFHNSIKFLLDPLFQGDGVDFNIDDKDIWFFPRISTIICDWPEACTFSLTYKSANSNYLCHFCLVQREDLIDIRKEVILRNHVNMKEYFNSNTSNLAGLEQVNNYFWSIPNLNIYAATVPDRMYHLDLGLFKYQIEFTMELLKKKKSLNKVNERIANIPRHSQLKVFKKGIQLSRLTASEYRDMMKIMVFVVDDLQIENLSEVYVKWNEMYLLSRSEKFKESDLENFQVKIII